MIYLTIRSQNPEEIVLEVHGWVSGANITILNEELKGRVQERRRIILNLDGVLSIDQVGLGLLRHWNSAGLVLDGGSPFIRMLLDTDATSEPEEAV